MQSSNDYNVIAQWSSLEKKHFRKLAIHNILATDMACHNDLVKDISARALESKPFDLTSDDERRSLYKFLLHSADLSNSVRPFHINRRICSFISDEFRNQAKKEEDCGIPITPFMILPDELSIAKAEIYFLQNIAKPYFRPQALCFESLTVLLQLLDNNIDGWLQRSCDLENPGKGIR